MLLEVRTTEEFDRWFAALRDRAGKVRIQARIDRLSLGNPGQHRNLEGGICEMKIDCGPGYRVYYARLGSVIVVLLCGGDKSTQQADIRKANGLARQL
jgi:putative addiction module killer protein